MFQKRKLSAPGREWGTALRADSSSTDSTKSESNLSLSRESSFLGAAKRALLALSLASFAEMKRSKRVGMDREEGQ
jgi:hypothetical protein